jgi:hypothetical protein
MTKKPASRGDTGLSKAFRQVSVERYAADPPALQAEKLARRFGLSPVVAAQVAELAFAVSDTWGSRA